MTIDEAIRHAEEVADEKEKEGKLLCQSKSASIGCLTCAEEHRQLAEWLRDYKRLKEQESNGGLISRQIVIEQINQWAIGNREYLPTNAIPYLMWRIQDLPSVNSIKQKKDPWIGDKPHAKDGFVVNCCSKY